MPRSYSTNMEIYHFVWDLCYIGRNYSRVLGKTKYWTLMSLPIVSFFVANLLLFGVIKQTIFFPSLLSYSSATIGTIILALTLLTLAKNMGQIHNNRVANYLTISAYGIVLFFEGIAFPVIHTPYPPYSALCWSFAGLGVFLYTLGIYFSAISVSHDSKLRLAIRQFTTTQSRLLDNIGTAQMEEAIQNRVTKIVKEQAPDTSHPAGNLI